MFPRPEGIGIYSSAFELNSNILPPPLWEATEAAERARIKADGGSPFAKPGGGGERQLTLATPILTFPHRGGRNQFRQCGC